MHRHSHRSLRSVAQGKHRTMSKLALSEIMEARRMLSTYVVNTTMDGLGLGGGLVSLRMAVADANLHAGSDTITFSSSVFTSSLHTIKLTLGVLELSDTSGTTTIKGPGASALAVNGNANGRVILIDSKVTAVISGLTATNGKKVGSAGQLGKGAGIYNAGTLTLTNVNVTGNVAQGGQATTKGQSGGGATGGGIFSDGSLSLVNCTISGNTAKAGSGYVTSYNFSCGCPATAAMPMAVEFMHSGSLTVTGSTISGTIAATAGRIRRVLWSRRRAPPGAGDLFHCRDSR